MNVYNIFSFGTYDATESQVTIMWLYFEIGKYLDDPETKGLFGFDQNYTYAMSSGDVYEALSPDFM